MPPTVTIRSTWFIAAADFEEERVITQDELAQLLLERRVEVRTKGPASSKIEFLRTANAADPRVRCGTMDQTGSPEQPVPLIATEP